MLDFIAFPIGFILKFIYTNLAFGNYGIAIILLTLFVKLLMMPLTMKQYHSSLKMSEIQPQMKEIQKKYSNDKEKLSIETMKLYKEENISPASALFPMIIQMPILFALYFVISQPLKYMVGKSPEAIQLLFEKIPATADKIMNMKDLSIINYFTKYPDKISTVSQMLKPDDLLNMNFCGINLGAIPTWHYSKLFETSMGSQNLILLLVPLVAAITTYISVKYSMQQTSHTSDDKMSESVQGSMALISPIMTGFVAFSVPAGLGLYWIIGNVFQIFQQMIINRFIDKKTGLSNINKKHKQKDPT
jgi:YidC/Oxa1 family membrane protein insertase